MYFIRRLARENYIERKRRLFQAGFQLTDDSTKKKR